jgi:hypothetical protein
MKSDSGVMAQFAAQVIQVGVSFNLPTRLGKMFDRVTGWGRFMEFCRRGLIACCPIIEGRDFFLREISLCGIVPGAKPVVYGCKLQQSIR